MLMMLGGLGLKPGQRQLMLMMLGGLGLKVLMMLGGLGLKARASTR